MSFLTPFMLFGALAAGIPIAIHLFFRSRYRTVPWAAMKFLLTSVEQTSRRLKFQELLLLILRVCVLLMLAVAFARPISSVVRGAGRGDAVDAVFVFDTSFSMGANDGANKTRLVRAKEEAIKIIDELPAHSTVQIITCAGTTKTLLGPHSPGNLDQARKIIDESLEIAHLATDLAQGVADAKEVLSRGQASNKELYVFSDMQKLGFEQQASELRQTLHDIKEKAVVHFVRCGTRPVKNVAIVGITAQSGVPRPGERVGFAILVRNTGTEAVENLTVSLAVDGDEKNRETTAIVKLAPKETRAVTLNGKMEKPGLRVLTAKVGPDDLAGDNQYDQVILVREQVNILVVDGAYKEAKPAESSSFFLMHALLPVNEADRARYHLQPRVPARLASPALLARQDICILVNCSVQAKAGLRAETLPADFVDALAPFVRQGHGLIVFGGENVQPDAYNKILYKKLGLLPMPIKSTARAGENQPFLVDRGSFGVPAFWKFKEDSYYEDLSKAEVWQSFDMDESAVMSAEKPGDAEPAENAKKDDNPVAIVLRLNNGRPLIASRKVDAGEVIFIGTAADASLDGRPLWTNWPFLPSYLPVVGVTISHLLQGQTQTYNLVAGQTLNWHPGDKLSSSYDLIDPQGKSIRLGAPEKINKRSVIVANDLQRAGVYRMIATPRGSDTSVTVPGAMDPAKTGTPIAVVPDLRESEDLTTLSDKEIEQALGFAPIHITAGGQEAASTGADRLNREWTVWALLAVLVLVLLEVLLAWWCGKAW